jgi:ribonucleoside-triphosphate reductase
MLNNYSGFEGFALPSQEFVYTRTYSRWLPELRRREQYPESVDRYLNFMDEELSGCITPAEKQRARQAMLSFGVMPSMRALWAAGPAMRDNHITSYNCSFVVVNCLEAFAETLYILMCGTGVGFSIENAVHVNST